MIFSMIQVRVWLLVDLRSQTEKEYLLIYKLLSPVHCMSCHFFKKGEMILQHYKCKQVHVFENSGAYSIICNVSEHKMH